MRLAVRAGAAGFVSCLVLAVGASAQARPGPAVTASLRSRAEAWNWFDDGPEGRYLFVGSLFRAGIAGRRGSVGWQIELAAPVLLGLPDDAALPPPDGQLGLGAAYWAANGGAENKASVFLKQAVLRIGAAPAAAGHSLRLGRFEFVDGAEVAPADPTLAAVKRDRIAHRLLGTFGFTHVGRSLDGVGYGYFRDGVDLTVVAARPTRGVFRTDGWGNLDAAAFYAALTVPLGRGGSAPSEVRLFGLHYRDHRDLPKVDNRPGAVRLQDSTRIAVTTVGGHALQLVPTGAGPLDLLAWGAWQVGGWGRQDHRGGALAVEAGFQPAIAAVRPWFRLGYYRSTGDDDPGDDRHGTFFQVLPTARIYARTPFYAGMNLEEISGSLILRPGRAVTIRGDLRRLDLTERNDLWYAGGGAFEPGSFGFAGRPSGGRSDLATLLDVSAEVRLRRQITVTGYLGRMIGRGVVEDIYGAEARGTFGYLELELRR